MGHPNWGSILWPSDYKSSALPLSCTGSLCKLKKIERQHHRQIFVPCNFSSCRVIWLFYGHSGLCKAFLDRVHNIDDLSGKVKQGIPTGACRKIWSTREQKELRAARKFFSVPGLARKVLWLGVLGLKYHVLGLKLVVSDQSNCS